MTTQDFYQLIDRSKTPDVSMRFALKTLVDKYPYFQAAIFTYLKCLYAADDKTFRPELQRLSMFVADKRSLFYYVLNEDYEKFFRRRGNRKQISLSRTNLLLNAFFETIDDSVLDSSLEGGLAETNMVSYDYFSYLNHLQTKDNDEPKSEPESKERLKRQDLIDSFISNSENDKGVKIRFDKGEEDIPEDVDVEENPVKDIPEDLQEDFFFTETLANIYIKQHKYERAYEIIKRLNLNFPEKNVYFANQISFLEKLIINKKSKK